MTTAQSPFGIVNGQRQGVIQTDNCRPLARHSIAFLLVIKARFGSVGCHCELVVRYHPSQLARRDSEAPLANANTQFRNVSADKVSFGRITSYCQGVVWEHCWPMPNAIRSCLEPLPKRNSAEFLVAATGKFWSTIGSRRCAIRKQLCQQPGRHSGLRLATAKAQFGNVFGNSGSVIWKQR